jgi:hypothetical protein
MQDDDLVIGGLSVPPALTALIRVGKWVPPSGEEIYVEVFGEGPELPAFYDVAKLIKENTSWQRLSVDEAFGDDSVEGSLGIDPRRSLAIADLGPDMPIVLDYRESRESPRVLYLGFSGTTKWIQVAANVEELIARLYPEGS